MRSSIFSYPAATCLASEYLVGGSDNRIVMILSSWNPGLSNCSRRKLLTINPAQIRSTNDSATSTVTSALRTRRARILPDKPCAPSFSD